MKNLPLAVLFCLFSQYTFSQQWQELGYFDKGIYTIVPDTILDRLYISGNFHFFDADTISGIGYWDGSNFNNMGCGFDIDCNNFIANQSIIPAGNLLHFQNALYAVGGFEKADGNIVNGIATWDGSAWHSIGDGFKQTNK